MVKSARYLQIIFVISIAVLYAGCQPQMAIPTPTPTASADSAATPRATDIVAAGTEPVVVSVNLGNTPQTLDPLYVSALDSSANDIVDSLFAGLTRLNSDTQQLELGLAQGWEQSNGGLTWQFTLREDIYWVNINPSSGDISKMRPITADDVIFAIQRACRPENTALLGYTAGIFVIKGCREMSSSVIPVSDTDQLGAAAIDENTVEFTLIENAASFPAVLAMPMLRPVPRDLVEAAGESWVKPDTIWTSGPFTLQPTIPEAEGYTLVANEYWPILRNGNISAVQISFRNSDLAFDAWQSNGLDAVELPQSAYESAYDQTEPGYRTLALPASVFIAYSYQTPPFNAPTVRQAFAYAIDRDTIIRDVLIPEGQYGIEAHSIVPPGMASGPYYDGGVSFDPGKAQSLMQEAGYPDCAGMPEATLLTDDTDGISARLAEAYVRMWEDVLGCDGKFTVYEMPAFDVFSTLRSPTYGIWAERPGLITLGWQGDYPDAQHWLADIMGCKDYFPRAYVDQLRTCNAADDDLTITAVLHDNRERAARYTRMEEILFGPGGEMPVIPVYYYARALAFQPWIEAYPQESGSLRFDEWVFHEDLLP